MKLATRAVLGITVVALAAQTASAHPIEFHAGGFAAGIAHPFLGIDHVLALIATGVWAAQCEQRVRMVLLAAFIAALGIGGAIAMAGFALPNVEAGVAATVLALGLLIALAVRLRLSIGASLAALFALWHGNAHGLEMSTTIDPLSYVLGFALASCVLVAGGLYAGRCTIAHPVRAKLFGAGIAAAGIVLIAGA